jgi:hypothetical protein
LRKSASDCPCGLRIFLASTFSKQEEKEQEQQKLQIITTERIEERNRRGRERRPETENRSVHWHCPRATAVDRAQQNIDKGREGAAEELL